MLRLWDHVSGRLEQEVVQMNKRAMLPRRGRLRAQTPRQLLQQAIAAQLHVSHPCSIGTKSSCYLFTPTEPQQHIDTGTKPASLRVPYSRMIYSPIRRCISAFPLCRDTDCIAQHAKASLHLLPQM